MTQHRFVPFCRLSFAAVSASLLLVACSGGAEPLDTADTAEDSGAVDVPAAYAFDGRDGGSSVAYDGQTFRHLLIVDMKAQVGGLTDRLNAGWYPEAGDVTAELDFYFSFDSATSGGVELLYATDPGAAQTTYDEVSSGKNLAGKIAGNDPEGQHADWSAAFVGWEDPAVTTPETLARLWFDQLDTAAVDWSNGRIPLGPDGAPVPSVYVTADGLDLQQLLQKFLTGAITFSQGADDYLDDDLAGAGLLSDHSTLVEGKPYTALEHAWDEGFGYFGASRDYCGGADATVADPGYADTVTPDGAIDLLTEVCWGHSTNAAKRDLGAVVATDFTAQAWEGFLGGRALLAATDGPLSAEELAELQAHRDAALSAWEGAVAASVVHYANEVLQIMGTFGTDAYDFGGHAKAWSEMKGFALAFQFSPRSPLSDAQFAELHALLGQAPVLPTASADEVAAYADDLRAARALLGQAYGFDEENLGGDDGTGGW